ncbi:MAG: Gfo/Idh/MocA family oxidoreductase [Acidobacteriota bacterium]|jgi:predicted dehydrogenase|nr:Gfo/Idh/MocA family oxidoreductase [Acidobacteriota bacterium]
MDKIRVGVVGVGSLGQHHARVYASLPGAELAGVVDTAPGRAGEIAAKFGTKAFADYTELFGKVDAVNIAAPTTLHAEIGVRCLDAGLHVLVEKPIAHTLEDADRLIQAAKDNGRILQVGHLERFNPAVVALREIATRPRFFEAHRMGLFSPRSLDVDVILDLMIHDLDIISLLVPSPVEKVTAVGIAILSNRIDIANARMLFADGCVANVTASRVSMEKIRKLRLFQRQEYISLDYTRQDLSVFGLSHADGAAIPEIVGRKIEPEKKEPLLLELASFLDAIRGLGPVACGGDEGRRALELAMQVREQAEAAQAREL